MYSTLYRSKALVIARNTLDSLHKSDVGAIMQAIKCISRNDKSFASVKLAVHKKLEPSNVQRTIEE